MTKDNTMPRADDLLKLAEKCEQATGPDRELDAEIAAELGWKEASALFWHDGYQARELPRFTRSIDAALTLVPEGCVFMVANTGVDGPKADMTQSSAIVGPPDDTAIDYTTAATPALALCAASLRARAQSDG